MRDMGDHYKYICVWVNDMLIAFKNPKAITDKLTKEYTIKGEGPPEYYLVLTLQGLKSLRKFSPWD